MWYNQQFKILNNFWSTNPTTLILSCLVSEFWQRIHIWRNWRVGSNPKKIKYNSYLLIFCAHALYKISSSWFKWFSSFNTNRRSNRQERDITLPMFYRIKSKVILTWILNNNLNFRIPSQAILYILCWQGFSIAMIAKSEKGHNSINVLHNLLKN